jgi:hypothetical protein
VTSRFRTAVLAPVVFVALLFILVPNVVIQPYTSQNPAALKISLFLLRYLKPVELICAIVAAILLIPARRSRWMIAGTAVVILCAVASRIDIYEILFHPLGKPSFQAAGETKLDGDEHLLAISLGALAPGNARAYPIRNISYHHIVNDVVSGVPIAVTY